MDAMGQDIASNSSFSQFLINICKSKKHFNISWNDAILGNAINMGNDLETTYLELEKVTNRDSNQNELKGGECKLIHLGSNWIRFKVLQRNMLSGNISR